MIGCLVCAEFLLKSIDDDCRLEQLLSSLGRPENPFSRFVYGNLASLQESNFWGSEGSLDSLEGGNFGSAAENLKSLEGDRFRRNLSPMDEGCCGVDVEDQSSSDEANLKGSGGKLCHVLRQFHKRMYSSHYMTLTLLSSSTSWELLFAFCVVVVVVVFTKPDKVIEGH